MTDDFEPHRRYLAGIAYRMLGSVAEAEDIVQDAFLRWHGVDRAEIREPRAYLARTVTHLCLDRLKSARAQRETYVGTWLPEPVLDADAVLAQDLSLALLMALERLSPLERAAFLLHDVFDMAYPEIADILERTEPACRQLTARAREHVRDRPRFQPTDEAAERLATAFHAAMTTGDLLAISKLLAEDAVFYSDGGGKRAAALNPIFGRDKILRFMIGVAGKGRLPTEIRPAHINGMPGFVTRSPDGLDATALEIRDDRVVAIYMIRNPDKLRHLA